MSFHLQTNTKDSLHNAFIDALGGLKYQTRRDHKFLILSCYIDFEAIKKIISKVRNEVRLTEISLAFEFFEAFRGRRPNDTVKELNKLTTWCKHQEIEFEWSAIRAGALMHAKGYAVIQVVKGEYGDGVVCVGSGNATFPGFGMQKTNGKPNVELVHISQHKEDVNDFISIWEKLNKRSKSLKHASIRADAYEFAYTLLASGMFLHDWRDSLRAQIGIKYSLTPEGQKAISLSDDLKQLGFNVDQATINRNPLDGVDFSFTRSLPKTFTQKYTVDSLIGRWCPHSVWKIVEATIERDKDFRSFMTSFQSATEPEKLQVASEEESKISLKLVSLGLVTEAPDRVERWKDKMTTLRENEDKLKRIFLKFHPFELPYDYSARDEVMELHDSLFESLEMKGNKSFVAKKIESAESKGNLSQLELTPQERDDLIEFLD